MIKKGERRGTQLRCFREAKNKKKINKEYLSDSMYRKGETEGEVTSEPREAGDRDSAIRGEGGEG